jgi:uncharacterized membrane protein
LNNIPATQQRTGARPCPYGGGSGQVRGRVPTGGVKKEDKDKHMFTLLSLQIVILLFVLITFWVMPSLMPADLAFGVRIPPNHQGDALIGQVRRDFRIGIVLIAIVLVIGSLLLAQISSSLLLLGITFATVFLASLDYYIAHHRLTTVKRREDWFAGQRQAVVVDTELQREPVRLPIPLLVLTIALVVAMFVIGAWRYPSLPDRIPTHFDANGVPNGWMDKGIGIFLTPLVALGETILFIVLALFLPRKQAQLDPANIEASRARSRQLQSVWGRSFLLIAVLTNSFMLIVSLVVWQLLPATIISIVAPIFPILILLSTLGILIPYYRQRRNQAQPNNTQTPYVARDDDRYWKGGMFYFNRDDPSIFVQKRFGIGWTINFGHPMGMLFMVVVIVIIVGSVVLPFF